LLVEKQKEKEKEKEKEKKKEEKKEKEGEAWQLSRGTPRSRTPRNPPRSGAVHLLPQTPAFVQPACLVHLSVSGCLLKQSRRRLAVPA